MLFSRSARAFFVIFVFLVQLCLYSVAQEQRRRPVLMISIDGLHPTYVTAAAKHGLKIPVLSSFLSKGAYAERVLNVSPTVTYPNHTTLVTGVLPSEHGIHSNTAFDPPGKEQGAWNWYGAQVKVPTLWQAAKKAGLVTGSVLWPVTVNSRAIDYNVPEYWRTKTEYDHYLIEAVSQPAGFLEEIEKTAGLFYSGAGDIVLDETITKTTIGIIESARPEFLTVHIVSLDHVQHETGPFSPQAIENLEKIDEMVGRLITAELKAHSNAAIAIVSDHGFFPVTHKLNLNAALVKAGLITIVPGAKPKVASWKAFAWGTGGSASVVVQDPNDEVTRKKVDEILSKLASNPSNGIDRILRGREAIANGAIPGAAFMVGCKSGYAIGDRLTMPVVQDAPLSGAHGYLNTHPELNSAFFIMGAGIAQGKNLGVIDMRQIAPTLARELGVALPTATMEALPLREEK